jgi:RHS repeat-associated protein
VTVLEPDFSPDANNSSDVSNPYTYTGRRLDFESGLYYYRNRYYHAQMGRFVSRDPIGYAGGSWNLYEYVGGRAVSELTLLV